MKIKSIKAREILDSRGNPTVETEVYLEDGSHATASIPSGGSTTSKYEAIELRDNDPNRYLGMGVLKAVRNVNEVIAPQILGKDASYQNKIDEVLINLDGTANKARLGANALLSVSQAVLETSAVSFKLPTYKYLQTKYQMGNAAKPMPTPIFNLINGGKHGAGNLDFQEFQIIPTGRQNFTESLQCGEEIYQSLKKVLIYRGAIHSVGDEGGFAPNLFTNIDALEILMEAIKAAEYEFGREVFLGIDAASSFFYQNGRYKIKDREEPFNREEMIKYYTDLNKDYRLFLLEDALQEDDWEGWTKLMEQLKNSTLIVGDDLLSTNRERVIKAIQKKSCNAILIKPNQVGTISEIIALIKICREAGWKVIISHRLGETNDDFIADFSVGLGADYTKFGAPARGERVVKYNRLLKIGEELTSK